MNLYPYQNQQTDFLLRPSAVRWKLVVGPTSSGKSAVIKTAAQVARSRGLAGSVLVLTSRRSLEESLKRAETFHYTPEGATEPQIVSFPTEDWTLLRDGNADLAWEAGRLKLWTQQGAVRIPEPPADLTGHVVVVDEAHHHGEGTELYRFLVRAWERGASIWSFTGTPTRSDGRRLAPVDPEVTILSQTTLMRLGWPKKILLRTVALDTPSETRANGTLLDQDYKTLVGLLLSSKRRTLVAVTPGSATKLAQRLDVELRNAGLQDRTLITTGNDTIPDEQGVLTPRAVYVERALDADRRRLAEGKWEETIRVLIDCRRCVEGMDAPGLSRLLSYGVPTSLQALVQRIGRLMRRKDQIPGFPEEHRDAVEVIFAVPEVADGEAARRAAVEQLVLLACYLNAPEVAHDYMEFWEQASKDKRLPPHAARFVRSRERLPEEEAHLRLRLMELGVPAYGRSHVTLADVAERIYEAYPNKEDANKVLDLTETLLLYGAEVEPKVLDSMREAVAKTLQTPVAASPDATVVYTNGLKEWFAAIVDDFKGLIVPMETRLVRGLEGALGAEEIERIGRTMAQARDAVYDLDSEVLAKALTEFKRARGRSPGMLSGVVDDLGSYVGFVYDSRKLDASIRRRWPGLTLAHLVVLHRRGIFSGPPIDLSLWPRNPDGRPKMLPRQATLDRVTAGNASELDALLQVEHEAVTRLRFPFPETALGVALAARYGWRGFAPKTDLGEALGVVPVAPVPVAKAVDAIVRPPRRVVPRPVTP